MSEAITSIVNRFYAAGADGSADDELIAEDLRYHGPAMIGELRGRAAFVALLDALRRGFPGFTTEIEEIVVQDDLAAARHTHRAVHRGEFNGIPPTGRSVEVRGIEILRIRDGQIAEFWHMDDFLGLMMQLGVIPPPR
jgi:steroid delta-isomerase-like uncharacterized protein